MKPSHSHLHLPGLPVLPKQLTGTQAKSARFSRRGVLGTITTIHSAHKLTSYILHLKSYMKKWNSIQIQTESAVMLLLLLSLYNTINNSNNTYGQT